MWDMPQSSERGTYNCGVGLLSHETSIFIKTNSRIALAFGVTVATLAQSIGHVSGCHINPAVTAGLLVGRKIGLLRAIAYIVAQCFGGAIGAGLLLVIQCFITFDYRDTGCSILMLLFIKINVFSNIQILTPEEFQGAKGLGKTALGAGVSAGQVGEI